MKVSWPKYVELPEKIGAGREYYENGDPCCAAGFIEEATGIRWYPEETEEKTPAGRVVEAFVKCARAEGVPIKLLGDMNDSLPAEKRPLVYAAAWAMCGYTDNGWPEANKLAKKAEKKFGRVRV
jgi:hypothetical protein